VNEQPASPGGPGLATEFADADDSPGLILWRVTNTWQAAVRAALRPLGLTHVQFVLLASLTWLDADGPVSQKQLAVHAATDPMMTSQVLRTLEEHGLVVRAPHPHDRRARALTVTAAGRHLADQAVSVVEACDRAFFAPLGEDSPRLAGLLARLLTGSAGAGDPAGSGGQPVGRDDLGGPARG
jgi:DNA-binding MarR family transcriptional regulator